MAVTTHNLHLRSHDDLRVTHQVINTGGVVTLLVNIEVRDEQGDHTVALFLMGDPVSKRPDFAHARALAEGVKEAVEAFVTQFPGVKGARHV